MNNLNFTTQNSFLHYGVKGMQWGVITSEYEPVGRKKGRQKNVTGKANSIGKNGEGLGTGKVGSTPQRPQMQTVSSRNRPSGRQKNVTGKANPIEKKGEGLGTGPVGNGSIDRAKNLHKKAPKANNKEYYSDVLNNMQPDEYLNALNHLVDGDFTDFEGYNQAETQAMQDEINSYYEDTYEQAYDKGYEAINRYADAFESISDMDPKYSERLFDKYKDEIQTAVDSWLDSLDYGEGEARQTILSEFPEANMKNYKDFLKFKKNVFDKLTTAEAIEEFSNSDMNVGYYTEHPINFTPSPSEISFDGIEGADPDEFNRRQTLTEQFDYVFNEQQFNGKEDVEKFFNENKDTIQKMVNEFYNLEKKNDEDNFYYVTENEYDEAVSNDQEIPSHSGKVDDYFPPEIRKIETLDDFTKFAKRYIAYKNRYANFNIDTDYAAYYDINKGGQK